VAKATDPLERLRALTALSTARAPESDELEEAFIEHVAVLCRKCP
jgi:hypothetical protein